MGAAHAMAVDHRAGAQLPLPPPLSPAAAQLLGQAARALAEAAGCTDARQRYATAHLGALRGAAAVLAARTRPEPARRRPRSAWVLLGQVAPELEEWATFFAAGAAKRAAAEAGLSRAVTDREADDLVRDVGAFLTVVEQALGGPSPRPRPHLVDGSGAGGSGAGGSGASGSRRR